MTEDKCMCGGTFLPHPKFPNTFKDCNKCGWRKGIFI